MRIIDSHCHVWRLDAPYFAWPTVDLAQIYRDFSIHDYTCESAAAVSQTVIVQTAASIAETQALLTLATEHSIIAGVVGWLPLDAPAVVQQQLDALPATSALKGVRPMLPSMADDAWICAAQLQPSIDALVAHNLTFDALLTPRSLDGLYHFAVRNPGLPIVIDHAAKPNICSSDGFKQWQQRIQPLSRLDNVYCKLSGLVTEANSADVQVLIPYLDYLLESFGAKKLMYGSDWPVVKLVCNYHDWLSMLQYYCQQLTLAEQQAIFFRTAQQFYTLDR